MLPTRIENPGIGDYDTPVVLDVHLLLLGVTSTEADSIMAHVVDVYAPLNIGVMWTAEVVDLGSRSGGSGGPLIDTTDSQALIDASKDHLGGVRPTWADVVYTMVGSEIASSVAGQADCVGGIVYPDAAFAVGEANTVDDFQTKVSGKIAAHEIAHLLAAHHHFANCVEGDPSDVLTDLTPCTLLFNDVGFISLKFSTLEGAVVRRYAVDYADNTPTAPGGRPSPTPSEPQPSPSPGGGPSPDPEPSPQPDTPVVERTVTLKLRKMVAKGRSPRRIRAAIAPR